MDAVAAAINYSRGHLSRLINSDDDEDDSSAVEELLMEKYAEILRGVTFSLPAAQKRLSPEHLYAMFMRVTEVQTGILRSIESKMARADTQATIIKKIDQVVSSLTDAKEVEILASKHQEKQFQKLLKAISGSTPPKKNPSRDEGKKLGENDGDGQTPRSKPKGRK